MEIHKEYFRDTPYRILVFKEVTKIFPPIEILYYFLSFTNKTKL